MKNRFNLFAVAMFAIACFIGGASAQAQSTPQSVVGLVEAQDAMLEAAKAAAKSGNVERATAAAEAFRSLQAAEEASYRLFSVRSAAPQMISSVDFERAALAAKAAGVDPDVVAAAKTEWKTSPSLYAAEAVIARLAADGDHTLREAKLASGWRKWLPAWAGGTTSYANVASLSK